MSVRLYFELAKKAAQRQMAYREANLAGMATNLFFGALRAYLLIALYGAQPQIAGYTLAGAITYTGVTQAMLRSLQLFGWQDIMNTIRSGDIASDLAKPFDYYAFWLAQDVGANLVHLAIRGMPIMLAYAVFTTIVWPATWAQAAAFAASLLLAMLISFGFRFCLNIIALWTMDARGFARLAYTFEMFLSGFLVPVTFFPPWLKTLANWTPFPSIVETPMQVWLGILSGPAAAQAILGQVVWFVVLVAVGRFMLAAGVRKLVIQGG